MSNFTGGECPFCGAETEMRATPREHYVECPTCGATGPRVPTTGGAGDYTEAMRRWESVHKIKGCVR